VARNNAVKASILDAVIATSIWPDRNHMPKGAHQRIFPSTPREISVWPHWIAFNDGQVAHRGPYPKGSHPVYKFLHAQTDFCATRGKAAVNKSSLVPICLIVQL